jgi:DDE family transposase
MKNKLMPVMDKFLLRKCAIAETIIDQLKNISQIEHSHHRSPVNFLINLLCGLIAYCHRPKKPSLNLGALPALIA